DKIRSVNEQAVTNAGEARTRIHDASLTNEARLTVLRDGREEVVVAHPAVVEGVAGRGIGVGFADMGTVRWPWWQAPIEGIKATAFYTKMIVMGLFGLVRDLVVTRHVSQQVSGPLGIAVITGQVAHQGVWALLNFAAILSINLAVVNFLPIPGLDGGRAIFLLAEFARRKRVSPALEATIHGIGFIALLILIVLVTIQDLFHYGPGIWHGIAAKF
ncbi:site-2 protease family protein, partial [Patescibacteria group bacterium]|nr:site-2 protease family protein [Patescibacteria group bacterium]